MMSANMGVSMPRELAPQGPSQIMMREDQNPHLGLPRDTETAPPKTQAQMVSSNLTPAPGVRFSF